MYATLYKYLALAAAALAVAAVICCVFFRGSSIAASARADAAEERARTLAQQVIRADQIIKAERIKAQMFVDIAAAFEQGREDAQATGDRVDRDLRSGELRLRDEWRGCETRRVSEAATAARELDAAEQRRIEGARDLVRLAAEWDAKERALQAVAEACRL